MFAENLWLITSMSSWVSLTKIWTNDTKNRFDNKSYHCLETTFNRVTEAKLKIHKRTWMFSQPGRVRAILSLATCSTGLERKARKLKTSVPNCFQCISWYVYQLLHFTVVAIDVICIVSILSDPYFVTSRWNLKWSRLLSFSSSHHRN